MIARVENGASGRHEVGKLSREVARECLTRRKWEKKIIARFP